MIWQYSLGASLVRPTFPPITMRRPDDTQVDDCQTLVRGINYKIFCWTCLIMSLLGCSYYRRRLGRLLRLSMIGMWPWGGCGLYLGARVVDDALT